MIIENHYCVLDIETGGLTVGVNPICEIAFVVLDRNFQEVDRFTSIIKPYGDNPVYSPQAMATHGISMKEILSGTDIKDALTSIDLILSKYSKGRSGKVILVHHNSTFDYPMMKNAYEHCRMDIHKYTDEYVVCTLRQARLLWGHDDSMANFKLATCCERIGIDMGDAHRALGDAMSTGKLLKGLIGAMRGGSVSVKSIIDDDYRRPIEFKF